MSASRQCLRIHSNLQDLLEELRVRVLLSASCERVEALLQLLLRFADQFAVLELCAHELERSELLGQLHLLQLLRAPIRFDSIREYTRKDSDRAGAGLRSMSCDHLHEVKGRRRVRVNSGMNGKSSASNSAACARDVLSIAARSCSGEHSGNCSHSSDTASSTLLSCCSNCFAESK